MHLAYLDDLGARRHLRIYPTLQFLYSHHVRPEYVTPQVRLPPLARPRLPRTRQHALRRRQAPRGK